MKILMLANNQTALGGMVYIAEKVKKQYPTTEVSILCEHCYLESEEYSIINTEDSQYVNHSGRPDMEYHGAETKNLIYQGIIFIKTFFYLGKIYKYTKRLVAKINPDIILVYSDRMVGYEQAILKTGRLNRIPTIVVPIASSLSSDSILGDRLYNLGLKVTKNRLDINYRTMKLNPGWAFTENGETRLFYMAGIAFAGYCRGMISKSPWINGAGNATIVCVENEDLANKIHGIASDKTVVITGLVEDYEIVSQKKERNIIKEYLVDKYSLNREYIVVFAMPQLPEHNFVSWDIHKENMLALFKVIFEQYDRVLVSLHPKSKKSDYSFLNCYCEFANERLREIIVGCDMLIASGESSVNRWASLLNIHNVKLKEQEFYSALSESQIKKVIGQIQVEKQRITTNSKEISVKNIVDVIEDMNMNSCERGCL